MIDQDRMIDRLVDGELSEADRRALLASFEADPSGWRRCAMAFLEAQAWRESLGTVAAHVAMQPPMLAPARPRFGFAKTGLAIAASVLVAFSVGRLSKGERQPVPTIAVVQKTEPTPETITQPQPQAEPPKPDPLITRLESRGYQVDRRQRVVAIKTQDGRRVAVPVAEVRVKYVGDRTY